MDRKKEGKEEGIEGKDRRRRKKEKGQRHKEIFFFFINLLYTTLLRIGK